MISESVADAKYSFYIHFELSVYLIQMHRRISKKLKGCDSTASIQMLDTEILRSKQIAIGKQIMFYDKIN